MKTEFIINNGSSKLILIFAGWSTDPSLYKEIRREGWDVLVAYDYSDLDFQSGLLENYDTIWLFAWSLGVFISDLVLDNSQVTSAIAINGTLDPVSDTYGIPLNIYDNTTANLNRNNLIKFRKRMAGESAIFREKFSGEFDDERIEELKRQLEFIGNLAKPENKGKSSKGIKWNRAYISENDRIFPAQNMIDACESNETEAVILKGSNHYINIADIIDLHIPNLDKIRNNFSKANILTYDANASAQRHIAHKLAELISGTPVVESPVMLEIGCGSGILSKALKPVLEPSEAHFVDLTPVSNFNIAPAEKYYAADAEQWIKDCKDKYDIIVSASTMQWFMNIPLFLENCRKALKDNGVLAFSTFLPGNLSELDGMRPSPLLYHDEEYYQNLLAPYFKNIRIISEDIRLDFKSHRELLMHIKHTGVAGSAPSIGVKALNSGSITSITYRPVYVICY